MSDLQEEISNRSAKCSGDAERSRWMTGCRVDNFLFLSEVVSLKEAYKDNLGDEALWCLQNLVETGAQHNGIIQKEKEVEGGWGRRWSPGIQER